MVKMNKQDEMKQFIKELEGEFGDGTAFFIDDGFRIKVDVIPTGIEVIDRATGIGGIPRGRISEVFGQEATGKTTLCFHTIAQAQKMGLGVAFIDAEHASSLERMEAVGIDPGRLVFSQPDSGEQALDIVEMMASSGKFGIICVDSVAALTPQVELEKNMGESVMGVHAKLLSQAMRKLTAPISKSNTALVFTNQTRSNIGGYGAAEVTTGGNALKFYTSLRLKMQFTGKIENTKGERISGKYKMTVVKNKMACPFKVAEFEINGNGIDDSGFIVQQLIDAEVLEKSGAFLKFEGEVLAQGTRNLAQKLVDEPELREKLVLALHKKNEVPA